MPQIKLLSEKTINQIAAGEVIERPVSVVKELVENSIDAGATKIYIEMENSGKNLISVSDNGCGISQMQLQLATERHATSKLDEEDINNIRFFGFRGEALPSIGAIAKMRIISRTQEADSAWQIQVEGGIKQPIVPASRGLGTTIEIRDLFCYTPTRLKFLKSDIAEKIAAIDLINRFALANPSILINLKFNGKLLVDAKPVTELKQKVQEILGEEFIKNSLEFTYNKNGAQIYGFAGAPTFNHSTSNNLYVFVNSRNVKDKLIATAIRIAYVNLIPQNRYPSIVLFIEINPYEVDVNVHPTKSEVRFRDANLVKSLISDTIRTSLRTTLLASNQNTLANTPNFTNLQNYSKAHSNNNYRNIAEAKSNYTTAAFSANLLALNTPLDTNECTILEEIQSTFTQPLLVEETNYPLGVARFQIFNTYIIAQSTEGVIIVDQHAAHERLVLENIKSQLHDGKIRTQVLLIPQLVELNLELVEKLLEFQEEITTLGFVLERNGNSQIIIREIPAIFADLSSQALIKDLAEMLFEYNSKEIFKSKQEEILGNFACQNSVRAGRKLNIAEMNALLRQIETTPFAGQCNHGRPAYFTISINELAKKFERI